LIHAAHAFVLSRQSRLHHIPRAQFHHQVTATPTTGAQWNFGQICNAAQPDASGARLRPF
jgi:hypothetical protein